MRLKRVILLLSCAASLGAQDWQSEPAKDEDQAACDPNYKKGKSDTKKSRVGDWMAAANPQLAAIIAAQKAAAQARVTACIDQRRQERFQQRASNAPEPVSSSPAFPVAGAQSPGWNADVSQKEVGGNIVYTLQDPVAHQAMVIAKPDVAIPMLISPDGKIIVVLRPDGVSKYKRITLQGEVVELWPKTNVAAAPPPGDASQGETEAPTQPEPVNPRISGALQILANKGITVENPNQPGYHKYFIYTTDNVRHQIRPPGDLATNPNAPLRDLISGEIYKPSGARRPDGLPTYTVRNR